MTDESNLEALEAARNFVSNSPFPMALLNLDGRVLATSVSPLTSPGWSRNGGMQAITGQRVGNAVPEAAQRLREVLGELARGVPVVEDEQVMYGSGDRRLYVRAQTSYWRDRDGQPAAVLCAIQDISAEVVARTRLKESEARLRAVIENMPAQISLTDIESGQILLMNSALSKSIAAFNGATEGAVFAQTLSPGEIARTRGLIERAEANGGLAEIEHHFKEGPAAGSTYRMKYVVFSDIDGQRQLLWTAEDVTELRQAAEAARRSAAEAEAANAAKSAFLANMSHEIRTPLNGVMGIAGALAQTALSPPQQEMVSLIETSASTLETLLSDILDLARIEAGKMEIRPEPFDLARSAHACVALFEAAAQAKGIDLRMSIAPAAFGAYVGDAARIRQILSNLLGNAVKFTQVGTVDLSVSARDCGARSQLRFEVRDTGIGFDAETKARLFSRFEQADGSITRRFGGSGLGLAISRSLAEAMGGRLEADAAPDRGAIFALTLDLPRCRGAADSMGTACEPDVQPDLLDGMRVLLAEDHPINRRVIELILGASGVELTCVENGAEAVDAFRATAFDLILMDMQMPVMDGLTAIREIRKLEAASGAAPTVIQVFTANAMPEHVRSSIAAGADGHLSKPIIAEALLSRLGEIAASLQDGSRAAA